MSQKTDKNPFFFYDKSEFSFLHEIESKWTIILSEYDQLSKKNHDSLWLNTFPEYVTSENSRNWKVFTFLFFLMKSPKHARLCPQTADLIYNTPSIISCDFSLLPANTKIAAHNGYSKMILRCHLPLIVPKGNKCGLKVGNETHFWKEGELVIFDDSFVHEAWNHSKEDRVVLMFDIPNPKWEYSAYDISKYKIDHIDDPFLLSFANKEKWLKSFKDRVLPLEEF